MALSQEAAVTLEDFQDALDRHGCRLADWPQADAIAAQGLLQHSQEAQIMLAEAERLDMAMAGLLAPPIKAPSRLKASIFDQLPNETVEAKILPFPAARPVIAVPVPVQRQFSRPAAFAAAAMIVCFVGGICTQAIFSPQADAESTYIAAVYGDLAY